MKCAYCESRGTKVLDKREPHDASVTRRRRECLRCKKRFTTYERAEEFELAVVKKDGRREQFNREKLKTGIMKACEKRPISVEQVDAVVDEIESELRRLDSQEVKSKYIGELVMKKLRKLDKIAYIRFAAVYREMEDLEDFEKEIKKLVKR
ncbi:transcriptional regulator NrdR [Candidatus Woesearchaeota archaeon]|nr:transcriptional regulator NrdR [Candidatus Woesearchaeota archaeon]